MTSKKPEKKRSHHKKPDGAKADATTKAAEAKKGSIVDVEKLGKPMQTYNKSLAVTLTPTEKDARSREAAKVYKTIEQVEFAKKAFSEERNAEIKKHEARLKELMGAMETGKEDREIRVGAFHDRQTNQVLTVVLNTGEVLERRTMTAEEKVASEPKKPGTVTKLSVVTDVPTDAKKGGSYTEKHPDDKGPAKADGEATSGGMKLYELAKDLGYANQDLIGRAGELGIKVVNHMADLDAEQVARLREAYGKRGTAEDLEPEGGSF